MIPAAVFHGIACCKFTPGSTRCTLHRPVFMRVSTELLQASDVL
jgi:hypothetical protein